MDSVNKTLYIPLYGKNYVSKKGIIITDKTAEEIWEKEKFPVGRKSMNRYLAYFMAMRAKVFDKYLVDKISLHGGQITVIHLGCGLDSRYVRVESRGNMWYDADLPEVINERKKYFSENENYKMLPYDIRDRKLVENITPSEKAVIIMEGITMYLPTDELKEAINNILGRFGEVSILADFYSEKAAKLSKYKNPINEVGVTEVYGLDAPLKLTTGTSLEFVKEHDMTPDSLINELEGIEKFIFKNLYAGKTAKSLYRIYEYSR